MSWANKYQSIDREGYSRWRAEKLFTAEHHLTKNEANNLILTAHIIGEKLEKSLSETDQAISGYFYKLRDEFSYHHLSGKKITLKKIDEIRQSTIKEAAPEMNSCIEQKFEAAGGSIEGLLLSGFTLTNHTIRNILNRHSKMQPPSTDVVNTRVDFKNLITYKLAYHSQNMIMEALDLHKDLEESNQISVKKMEQFFSALENYTPADDSQLEHQLSIMLKDFSTLTRSANNIRTTFHDKKSHLLGNVKEFLEKFYIERGYLFAMEAGNLLVETLQDKYPKQARNIGVVEKCCNKIKDILIKNKNGIERYTPPHTKLKGFSNEASKVMEKIIDNVDIYHARKINGEMTKSKDMLEAKFNRFIEKELNSTFKNMSAGVLR